MNFKDTKVSVIFENQNGEILLQQRNVEPELGKWVPFGGSVEGEETNEQTARREIWKELRYTLGEINLFKAYILNDVKVIIFVATENIILD